MFKTQTKSRHQSLIGRTTIRVPGGTPCSGFVNKAFYFLSKLNHACMSDTVNNGWIKLHRKLLENPFYTNSKAVHLWVHLLMNANHKKKTFYHGRERVTVESGELITGYKSLEQETEINKNTIYYWFEQFQEADMIEVDSNNKYTKVKIENWNKYQKNGKDSKTNKKDNKTNISKEKDKKNKNSKTNKKRVKSELKASKKRIKTNNNDKNVNNGKEIKTRTRTQAKQLAKLFRDTINRSLRTDSVEDLDAGEDLIEDYGLETTMNAIKYVAKNYGENYMPKIKNLVDLYENMTDIIYHKKNKQSTEGGLNVVNIN
jgi:hypothetical protein